MIQGDGTASYGSNSNKSFLLVDEDDCKMVPYDRCYQIQQREQESSVEKTPAALNALIDEKELRSPPAPLSLSLNATAQQSSNRSKLSDISDSECARDGSDAVSGAGRHNFNFQQQPVEVKRRRRHRAQESQKQPCNEIKRPKENGITAISRKSKIEVPKRNRKAGRSDEESINSSSSSSSTSFLSSNDQEGGPLSRRQWSYRNKRKSPTALLSGSLDIPSPEVLSRNPKKKRTTVPTDSSSILTTKTSVLPSRGKPPINNCRGRAARFRSSRVPSLDLGYPACKSDISGKSSCRPFTAPTLVISMTLLELQLRRQAAIEAYFDAVERIFFPPVPGGFDELFYTWIIATSTKKKLPHYSERYSEDQRQLRLETLRNSVEGKRKEFADAAEKLQENSILVEEHLTNSSLFVETKRTTHQGAKKDCHREPDVEQDDNHSSDIVREEKMELLEHEERSCADRSYLLPDKAEETRPISAREWQKKTDGDQKTVMLKTTGSESALMDVVDAQENNLDAATCEWLNEWIERNEPAVGKDKKSKQQQYCNQIKLASRSDTSNFQSSDRISFLDFLRSPVVHMPPFVDWTPKEIAIFEVSLCTYGQNFAMISRCIESKSYKQAYDFYAETFKQTNRYEAFKDHKKYAEWFGAD